MVISARRFPATQPPQMHVGTTRYLEQNIKVAELCRHHDNFISDSVIDRNRKTHSVIESWTSRFLTCQGRADRPAPFHPPTSPVSYIHSLSSTNLSTIGLVPDPTMNPQPAPSSSYPQSYPPPPDSRVDISTYNPPIPVTASFPAPDTRPDSAAFIPQFPHDSSFPGPDHSLDPAASVLHIAPTPSFQPPPDPRLDQPLAKPHEKSGLRSAKSACEYSVREYLALRRQRRYDDPAAEHRLRTQYDVVLSDLQTLRRDVSSLVKAAEGHRWRKWIVGGVV